VRECNNSKIHISSNFLLSISLIIMLDTLLLVPSLHCNTSIHLYCLYIQMFSIEFRKMNVIAEAAWLFERRPETVTQMAERHIPHHTRPTLRWLRICQCRMSVTIIIRLRVYTVAYLFTPAMELEMEVRFQRNATHRNLLRENAVICLPAYA